MTVTECDAFVYETECLGGGGTILRDTAGEVKQSSAARLGRFGRQFPSQGRYVCLQTHHSPERRHHSLPRACHRTGLGRRGCGSPEQTAGGDVPTIVMRIPKRQEIALDGRRQVGEALRELGIAPETVLVIKGNRLLTRDAWLEPDDVIEVRPVMSGGS